MNGCPAVAVVNNITVLSKSCETKEANTGLSAQGRILDPGTRSPVRKAPVHLLAEQRQEPPPTKLLPCLLATIPKPRLGCSFTSRHFRFVSEPKSLGSVEATEAIVRPGSKVMTCLWQ